MLYINTSYGTFRVCQVWKKNLEKGDIVGTDSYGEILNPEFTMHVL